MGHCAIKEILTLNPERPILPYTPGNPCQEEESHKHFSLEFNISIGTIKENQFLSFKLNRANEARVQMMTIDYGLLAQQ